MRSLADFWSSFITLRYFKYLMDMILKEQDVYEKLQCVEITINNCYLNLYILYICEDFIIVMFHKTQTEYQKEIETTALIGLNLSVLRIIMRIIALSDFGGTV